LNRSKGETEESLSKLGYKDCIILRPGFLIGTDRKERVGETIAGYIAKPLSLLSNKVCIKVAELAQSAVYAAQVGSSNLPAVAGATQSSTEKQYTIIGNAGALGLTRLFKEAKEKSLKATVDQGDTPATAAPA